MPGTLKHILYVEDEPDIRTVVSMTLELVGGYRVTACGSGREALARMQDQSFDLVLLDVMMPELDGPATLAAMRERSPGADPAVVFMTAKTQASDVQRFREMGVKHIIPKPFEPAALAGQVEAIWAELEQGVATA